MMNLPNRQRLSALLRLAGEQDAKRLAELEASARRGTATVEDRVVLACSAKGDSHAREEHLVWLIQSAPALDWKTFSMAAMFWTFVHRNIADVRALWERAIALHPLLPAVVKNATASLAMDDPTFGESIYRRCQLADPLNAAWHRGLGELYEFLSDASHFSGGWSPSSPPHLHERAGIARLAVSSYMTAFVLMAADDARFDLLWPMRHCVAASGDEYLGSVLRVIEQERADKRT